MWCFSLTLYNLINFIISDISNLGSAHIFSNMIITTIHLFFFNFIHLIFLDFRNIIPLFYYTLCHIPCKIIHLTFLNSIPLHFIPLYITILHSIFIFSQDKKKDIIPFYSNNTDITSFFIFTHATIILITQTLGRRDLSSCFVVHICTFYSSYSSNFAFLFISFKIFRAKMEPTKTFL